VERPQIGDGLSGVARLQECEVLVQSVSEAVGERRFDVNSRALPAALTGVVQPEGRGTGNRHIEVGILADEDEIGRSIWGYGFWLDGDYVQDSGRELVRVVR
jgi:hypothetical protein